jgi:predicted transport protein
MKVKILDETIVENPAFDYLSDKEKRDIQKLVKEEKALTLCVLDEKENPSLFSVLEFYPEYVHVREVCGSRIFKFIGAVEVIAHALAKRYNKKYVSFRAEKDGIKMLGERLGYEPDQYGDFQKAVVSV